LPIFFFCLSGSIFANKVQRDRYKKFSETFDNATILTEENAELLKFGTEWECWTIGPLRCDFGKYHGPKVRYNFFKAKENEPSLLPFIIDDRATQNRNFLIVNQTQRQYEDKYFYFGYGLKSVKQKTELRITKNGYLITRSIYCGSHRECGSRYSLCRPRYLETLDYQSLF